MSELLNFTEMNGLNQ